MNHDDHLELRGSFPIHLDSDQLLEKNKSGSRRSVVAVERVARRFLL